MAELAVGAIFAGYRIEELAGRGGMGVVFRARHLRLDRVDALKVIAPEFADDLSFRARFERESQVAAQIDHPHVIRVYNADEKDGRLYLAMQFVEGTDLRAELHRCGRFEVDRAIRIVSEVGSALDAAHANGLVHRDVKPANVLLTVRDGRDHAYLTDFGLTKRLDSHGKETRTGMFVGTTDYVAPEQVRGEQLDARTDVYSLGCVLYHLLSGRVPYPADNDVATLYAHLSEPAPSLAELRPELAELFDPVIQTALAKDSAQRYASAGKLAEAASAAAQRSSAVSGGPESVKEPTKTEDAAAARAARSGWYPEPRTGRVRRWTGREWAEYAPDGSRADVLPPPGWYPEPGTGRMRRWTGSAWLENGDRDHYELPEVPPTAVPSSPSRSQFYRAPRRGRTWFRWTAGILAALFIIGAVANSADIYKKSASGGSTGSLPSGATRRAIMRPVVAQLKSCARSAVLEPANCPQTASSSSGTAVVWTLHGNPAAGAQISHHGPRVTVLGHAVMSVSYTDGSEPIFEVDNVSYRATARWDGHRAAVRSISRLEEEPTRPIVQSRPRVSNAAVRRAVKAAYARCAASTSVTVPRYCPDSLNLESGYTNIRRTQQADPLLNARVSYDSSFGILHAVGSYAFKLSYNDGAPETDNEQGTYDALVTDDGGHPTVVQLKTSS